MNFLQNTARYKPVNGKNRLRFSNKSGNTLKNMGGITR